MSHITTTPLRQRLLHTSKSSHLLTLILMVTLLAWGNSAWGDTTVDDLVTINEDWTFIADDITANGTAELTANTLYCNGKIFAPTNNSKSNSKGKNNFAGGDHLNSLRLKNAQDRLAFKVARPCKIKFYTESHNLRGIVITKTDRTSDNAEYTAYAQQPVSTPIWEIELDEAGTYYLSSHGGDFFFAGFELTDLTKDLLDFSLNFIKPWAAEKISTSGSASKYYVTATNDGVPTLAMTQPDNYLAYFEGYYKNDTYGLYYNAKIQVPVKAGKYEISLGMSDNGGDISVHDGTSELGPINNKGAKFSQNSANVSSKTITVSENCTLDITVPDNNTYIPYFQIKEIDQSGNTLNVKICTIDGDGNIQENAQAGSVAQAGEKYPKGTEVSMTATPNHGYRFVKWQDASGNDIAEHSTDNPYTFTMRDADVTFKAVFKTVALYELTTSTNPADAGTITRTPNYTSYIEGESVKVVATPNEGYQFVNWTDGAGTEVSTSASYIFDMLATPKTLTANFKQQYSVTFGKGDTEAEGILPAVIYVQADNQTKFTVPSNFTLYKAGQTLRGWTDGVNTYNIGERYTVTGNISLTPIFSANTVSLKDLTHETTVKWEFGVKNGVPKINEGSNKDVILVAQVNIDGTVIDLPMRIATKNGKFDNHSRTDEFAQVNSGSEYTVPSSKNSVATLCSYGNKAFTDSKVDTQNLASGPIGSSRPYAYKSSPITSDEETITIVIGTDMSNYMSSVSMTYPSQKVASDLTVVSGKGYIELNKGGDHYTLRKGADKDFTTSSTGALKFTSGDPGIATVNETTGEIAPVAFGTTTITVHQAADATHAPGSIEFTVKVVAAAGQTNQPTVTISENGTVSVSNSTIDSGANIYYTLDGTTPTEGSSSYSSPFDANNKILKVIAVADNKSPSDVVTAYVNVTGSFTWAWNASGAFQILPGVSGNLEGAYDENTKAIVGAKIKQGFTSTAGAGKNQSFATFTPQSKLSVSNPDESATITFNVIPKAGISFKPTAISFEGTRIATSSGLMDVKLLSEQNTYNLLSKSKPTLDEVKQFTQSDYSTTISDIPSAAEEWALKFYIYSLSEKKEWGLRNIVISGVFCGIEYNGVFFNVAATADPSDAGFVTRTPSAMRVMAGKKVSFKATANAGYKFDKWIDFDTEEEEANTATYTTNSLSKNMNLEAQFTKLPKITFVNNDANLSGSVPAIAYANEQNKFTIPHNVTLYREGWAVVAWTDGKAEYGIGTEQTFTEDVTLKPVVKKCDKKITDAQTPITARWVFDQSDGAPVISSDPIDMTYTNSVLVDGCRIDIPLVLAGAKMDNNDARVNRLDDGYDVTKPAKGGQINNNGTLTFPAVSGMIVRLKASGKIDIDNGNNVTNFTGETDETRAAVQFFEGTVNASGTPELTQKMVTYTYNGEATTLSLKITNAGTNKSWGFFEYLEVEYPVLPDVLLKNHIITTPLLSDKELAVNAGEVTKSATTHKNTGSRYKQGDNVTITATAKYGYCISAIKSGETTLDMTKTVTIPETENATSATATYTVGAETGTVTVEYQRLPMAKVRLESTDKKLGDVDFTDGSTYANFYTKGDGWVESWFVVDNEETAMSIAADDYVIDKWTQGSETGTSASTRNSLNITVTEGAQTYYAHFKHGEMGSVTFDIEHPVVVANGVIQNSLPEGFGDAFDTNSQAPANVTNSYSFTIPKYHTVFKTGYTLKMWKDAEGNDTYDLGANYSFKTSNQPITLVPVYEANPSDETNRINDPIMLYEFGTGKDIRAQQVKLEKSTTTYWTAQVYVVTITNSVEYQHYRDVPLDIITGSKGFVRNGDMPEWASFGPGTTFNVASCSGTKVEILSYAPMTTTTFGGKLFTLVSHDEAKHEYVYECTTQSAAESVPIVIGDDYSYYKYIKVYSKKANRVNLHVDVDDKARGKMTAVEAVNTSVTDPIIELEDGGNSFHQGNGVKLTFKRRFGFEFDKIVDLDKNITVLQMLPENKVSMISSNDGTAIQEVSASPAGTWTGSLFTLKRTEASMGADSLRTQYELKFNITTHRNIQVCFKEKPTYYVTYNAGKLATGTAPAAAWVEAGDAYVVPENRTLYYEGNTLKYWIDADYDKNKTLEENKTANHVYDIGQTYNNPGSDVMLYPVFEKNTFGLLDIPSGDGLTVTWPFAKNLGAPTINFERSAGILVSQLKKSETEWIDLKVDLDGSTRKDANGNNINGKFNNTASDDRCQINTNSILYLPTTTGCEISLSAQNEISSTIIAGVNDYNKGKIVKAIYNGSLPQQAIEFKNDGRYYDYFEVTYKQQNITRPTLASVKYGETSLSSEQLTTLTNTKSINMTIAPDLVNDAIPVVTATANNGGEVTITQADINNRSALITLKTAGGVIVETYSVNFLFSASSNPTLSKILVNGNECVVNATQENQTVLANQPVTGTIVLTFDRTMAAIEKELEFNGKKIKMSAKQGKVLEFHYWNISTGNTYQVYIPANTLVDVYGSQYTGVIRFQMTSSQTSIEPIHRTFDYIVGQDGNINEAIAAANSATGTDRYYIYIPDGEYELKGNQNITSAITSDGVAPADSTGVRRTDLIGQTFNNGMTQITRANVSLIGQSTKGVTLYNRPLLEGIGYTATIHVGKNATDFYAEDLQLVNRFPYWKSLNAQGSSGAGRAVAFWDQGNRSIMKNVEMWSYQDTYYSSNANDDYRGYFENCTIAGVVDFLCGDGNIWLDNCNIVLRDRAGNNIAAPSQERTQQWGYVFNNCSIKPEVDNAKDLKDRNWSLARPWASSPDKSPAITYLNTKMWLLPRDAGWEKMGTGAILRFHEYHSMDKGGNQISLGARSLAACAPGAGSDDCILSADDAATYTLENVLGGTDLFTPKAFTQQIDADDAVSAEKDAHNSLAWTANLRTDDDRLVWDVSDMALCYFVFKKEGDKWVYKTNVAQEDGAKTCSVSVEQYGTGDYCVRAANQRGGLGAPTKEIEFTVSRKYTLEIKQVGDTQGYGWSTLCLPYNSKVPVDLKVYAANGVAYPSEGNGTISTVDNYNLYLKEVTVVNKDKGYIVYGPVGTYLFASSSQTSSVVTILGGNPNDEPIPTGNNNCYVLANKETYGLGFYKYTGETLAAHRAWLPVGSVSTSVASNSAKAIKMVFTDEFGNTTAIGEITADGRYEFHKAEIYDLNGIRIQTPVRGRVYIINGEKRQWK